MAEASAAVALHVLAGVGLLDSLGLLLGAVPGDVAGLIAVVAGIVVCIGELLLWGQFLAKCPSPPHLKQLIDRCSAIW